MTIKQAAKTLARYRNQTRERPGTCYGGNGNVFECSCCGHALNVGNREHSKGCELAEALAVIEALDEQGGDPFDGDEYDEGDGDAMTVNR